MRPFCASLFAAAVSLFAHAAPVTNSNGSVMTPNSELSRGQPVATDVAGLLSSESDPCVAVTNGELWVRGERVASGGTTNDVRAIVDSSFRGGTQEVNRAVSDRRDRDDLRVYRRVRDIWTWRDWPNDWATTNAPADFIETANSPGAAPLEYRTGAWMYASQYWPNGNLKYDASMPPGSAASGEDLVLNFRFVARAGDGVTELFRFGATATRESATDGTLVDWETGGPPHGAPVRIATTDLVGMELDRKAGRDELVAATNGIRSVDGAARTLPKYLHERSFDSSYPDEAQEYYRSRGNGNADGGCSSVRDGDFLSRNFDYPFDDRAEFVVRMSAGPGRFASVGVAQVGTNLTEQFVTSGKPSRCYKWLPGATVDGINENGVVCNINVVDTWPMWRSEPTPTQLHPLAAVRWVLDHATNAHSAAEYIADNIRFPPGWLQNFHYMICDERETWFVEDGWVASASAYSGRPVMTNNKTLKYEGGRYVYDPKMYFGEGWERLLLLDSANITNVWYTNAYRRETNPPWVSDLADVLAYTNEIFDAWASHPKEYFRNKTTNGIPWWQTVHTSVYDIGNRVLRIAVQERDDWYVFQVPSSGGGVKVETDPTVPAWAKADEPPQTIKTNDVRNIAAEVVEPVASDLEMKIDRNGDTMNGELDMDYYDLSNVGSMNVGSLTVEDDLDVESADARFGGTLTVDGKSTLGEVSAGQIEATHLVASGTVKAGSSLQVGQTDVMQEIGGKIGKVTSAINGNFAVFSNGSLVDGGLSPGDVTAAIAGKRDVDDLLVYGLSADYALVTFEVTSDREIIAGTYTTDDGVLWVNFGNATRIRRSGTVFTLSDEFEEIVSTSWTGVPATGTIRIGTTTVPFGVNAYHDRIATESGLAGKLDKSSVDPTLATGGAPADAKATGDALAGRVPYSGATKDVDLGYRRISSTYSGVRASLDPYGLEIANTNGTFSVRYSDISISSQGASVYGMNDFHLSFPFGKDGDIAVEGWSSLRNMVVDANTNATADCECISTNLCSLISPKIDEKINNSVNANMNTFVDGETGVEYRGTFYGKSLYYVPTGNVYPPNN